MQRWHVRLWWAGWVMALALLSRADLSAQTSGLRTYETPFYTIYSDLDEETVKEAAARMTAMAREYRERTKEFSGRMTQRLPFYLFSRQEDYQAAGGMPGSIGVYTRKKLMALMQDGGGAGDWHVVQHEGFHQYAAVMITPRLPIWVNEGLAEYFGEGIWTGDNFVTGVIPPGRHRWICSLIAAGKMMSFADMLMMTPMQWVADLRATNYDQAWSMVHFLAHGDDGKYQKSFSAFIMDMDRGRQWKDAFLARFGSDVNGFQKRYEAWWTGLPAEATPELYARADVLTLTSFLARAHLSKQTFKDADDFFLEARAGQLRQDARLWLPDKLLSGALAQADKQGTWSLRTARNKLPELVLTRQDGTLLAGSFTVSAGQVKAVDCTVTPPPQE